MAGQTPLFQYMSFKHIFVTYDKHLQRKTMQVNITLVLIGKKINPSAFANFDRENSKFEWSYFCKGKGYRDVGASVMSCS